MEWSPRTNHTSEDVLAALVGAVTGALVLHRELHFRRIRAPSSAATRSITISSAPPTSIPTPISTITACSRSRTGKAGSQDTRTSDSSSTESGDWRSTCPSASVHAVGVERTFVELDGAFDTAAGCDAFRSGRGLCQQRAVPGALGRRTGDGRGDERGAGSAPRDRRRGLPKPGHRPAERARAPGPWRRGRHGAGKRP